jgi:glycosyltransferase involved in cell wall biosynthesis
MRRRPFRLIDAHYLYPDGVAAVQLGRRLGVPVVLTARGSDVNVLARVAAPRRMIVGAIRGAARVVAVSEALRIELVHLGAEESRISVLRNGVDLDVFRPAASATPARARKRLLLVGHLKEGKGHRLAIDAMAELADAELVIVGDGPLRDDLERYARERGVQERVRFAGRVAHAELPRFYNDADVLVLASEREGMPNVVLEALACGTPVVATAVGGIPEVLTDPVAGVLMTSRSPRALVTAVEQLFAVYPVRAAVRRFAERFDWQATVSGQLEVFREAVAAHERSAV